MEILTDFQNAESVGLKADLQILKNQTVQFSFEWSDPDAEIVFAKAPESGRHFNLWQQTCFEVFLQPKGQKRYYEINLSPKGAWNVYQFEDYRTPQPPQEMSGAELLEFSLTGPKLDARFSLKNTDLSEISLSLCAVLLLKNGRTTYWSTQHAKDKPDFHRFENFSLERKAP